jgi:membrane protein
LSVEVGKSRGWASFRAWARTRGEQVRAFVDRTFVGRWLQLLIELHFVDRSVALAAKGLLALLPALVTVAAVAPAPLAAGIVDTVQRRMGLSGASLELVRSGLTLGQPTSVSAGTFASLLTLFYATTFTTALRRVFLNTWRYTPVRDPLIYVKGLAWLAAVITLLWIPEALRSMLDGQSARVLVVVLTWASNLALWWCTAFVMLQGTVRWRVLLPPAVITTVGSVVYAAAANVWMPRSIVENGNQFGYYGVFMTVASWMVGLSFVIVCATALGPVLAYDRGRIGRLVRGGADPDVGTADISTAQPRS